MSNGFEKDHLGKEPIKYFFFFSCVFYIFMHRDFAQRLESLSPSVNLCFIFAFNSVSVMSSGS